MAYTKTVWSNNTPPDINAENLNNMEQGIADAQFPDGGSTGQILSKTNDGIGWIDAPNSAEWGNIDGQLSEQTDLYSELESKITMPSGGTTGQVLTKTASGQAWQDASGGGNVDTVNGIQPDTNKNVQTDVVLTQAEYDALPSSKLTDDVNYWIKDGTNLPQTSVISADGVQYTDSQTVKGALDEVKAGLATCAYVGQQKSFNITIANSASVTYNDTNYTIAGKTYIGTLIYSFAGAGVSITAGYAGLSIGVRFVVHNFMSSAQTIDVVYRHIYI